MKTFQHFQLPKLSLFARKAVSVFPKHLIKNKNLLPLKDNEFMITIYNITILLT